MAVLVLTLCYVGAGVALGQRQGKTGALMKTHPHFDMWVALYGLIGDGVAFSRSHLGGHHLRPVVAGVRQPLVKADPQLGDRARTELSDKSKRKEQRREKAKQSTGSKAKRTKGGHPSRRSEGLSPDDQLGSTLAVDGDATAQQRQLHERALIDERLHESQAKIQVIGLNG